MSRLSRLFRSFPVVLALILAGCASPPYARDGHTPTPVVPADASPARAALNARVYDAATRHATRLFHRADAAGAPFVAAVHDGRDAAIDAPDETALYAALDALLSQLGDDHTYAYGPTDRARIVARRAGRDDAGYGLLLTRVGDAWMVALVRPGTPAAEAGILPGWELRAIDGRPARIAAAPVAGRSAELRFQDDAGTAHTHTLTALVLPALPRTERRTLDDGTVYLRFDEFDKPRLDWMVEQIGTLAAAPPPSVVLDLRRNGGGSIDAAALVNALFFPDRQDFAILEGRLIDRRMTGRQDVHYAGPLRVLVGPASASASELLAARLQETGRATIVGQHTRGAVVGTRGIDLPDGGLMHVGQIVMSTAGGRSLEKVGVTPDVVVAIDWQAVRDGRDPALEATLALPREGTRASGGSP